MGNTSDIVFRSATRGDDDALAELINMAGEGMPLYLWQGMAGPGEDPWDVGRARARRDEGGFSWKNSVIAEVEGRTAGCLIGYALPETAQHSDYSDMPQMFVPLQQLEDLAPNTWYVNVVAVIPEFRGQGIGTQILKHAEQAARESARPAVSLIVADTNAGARRLYAECGFEEKAQRPLVREQWDTPAQAWVLMVKLLEP